MLKPFTCSLFAFLVTSAATLRAGLVKEEYNSTTALAYSADTSTADLINAGQPTLSSASVSATNATFPGTGISDGVCANSPFAANTYFQSDVHFPATATYQLNLASAPNGYDINSITSLMGWSTTSQFQANQNYTVEVSVVGSAGFRPLANVIYAPFSDSGGNYETKVVVRDDTAAPLATNVDAIRFIFADPGNNGTVVREIDVIGSASATAPPAVTVQTASDFSETDNAYAGASDVANNDLVNTNQPTLASFTSSTVPQFGAGGQNDGLSNSANSAVAAWYTPAKLPATLTFNLNTSAYPEGFVVNTIRTTAGWKSGGTQSYANQKYTVEYQTVSDSTWLPLEAVDFSPFNTLVHTPASTRVVLSAPTGNLLTGVAALRFNLQVPTRALGTNNGMVLQEIDVVGYPVNSTPVPTVAISSPTARVIVQRNASNTGTIPVTGSYTATPDRIEARAVVMAGPNSGTTTDWQTIVSQPAGSSFSGSLTNVPAGGWYRVEVRSVTGETPSTAATVDKVGVGDIYLTAGQSNSANHGAPGYTPTDDRVSVRTAVSVASWRHGYDPMPIATGTGGSVWSKLGDLLAAADNIPVGFLCVGVGSTQVSQWQPGTTNYDTRLKPALQSLPSGGFRAVLWHQGESDSIANVTAVDHRDLLATMITNSRQDAGWAVPWYVAEASFHPNTHLAQEEPVVAGQRLAVFADANVFLGPTTDSFHLEDASGGKLSDTVHFNAAGLLDHATQWRDILRGTASLAPRNGDFEENRNPAVTALAPLADGAAHVVDIASNNDSPSVIGWRILSAAGTAAADGSNGFHNPAAGTYAAAIDSVNNGVLPNTSGRHVALLQNGSAGNFFLHTTRAILQPNTVYTATVAIGVRDAAATFGGARLDLLADGQVLASATFDKAALDALHGGDCAGSFTNASVRFVTGATVPAGQPVAIRIAKPGATGTVLDFDHVRLTSSAGTAYDLWGASRGLAGAGALPDADADEDGIANALEFVLGGEPNPANPGSNSVALLPAISPTPTDLVFTFRRSDAANAMPGTAIGAEYGSDLTSWTAAVHNVDGVTIAATDDGFGTGMDKVDVSIPKALAIGSKLFVRLSAATP